MNRLRIFALSTLALGLACADSDTADPTARSIAGVEAEESAAIPGDGPIELAPAVFDIATTADGGILAAGNAAIREIRHDGVSTAAEFSLEPRVTANGVAAMSRGNFFVATGGGDLAAGAAVWHVSRGGARLVGDIEAFETANDPDAFEGVQWKDQACEEDPSQGFSAGPQSNPYHLTRLSGSEALVADAAGNTLLSVKKRGDVDWVAVFTPPVDAAGDYRVLFPLDAETDCYVQPVPTSVAVGPDGAVYVGELTGAPAVPGWSRVWRIAPGARNVTCPSGDCTMLVDGMTSIIDVEFGPDGYLYVVEYDENGWLAVVTGAPLAGGTVNRCDTSAGTCEVVEGGLFLPSAIAFDKRGDAWLLESNIIAPTVRRLN